MTFYGKTLKKKVRLERRVNDPKSNARRKKRMIQLGLGRTKEVEILIELWSQHENLYNTKNRLYFNRDLRQ